MSLQTDLDSQMNDFPLFEIEPSYAPRHSLPQAYIETIQNIAKTLLEEWAAEEFPETQSPDPESLFSRLGKALPLFSYPAVAANADLIPISTLIPGAYTDGAGRYISDMISRWLVPGKNLKLVGIVGLNIRLIANPSTQYYLMQIYVAPESQEDMQTVLKNLPSVLEEIKINIMAVYHARYIASLRSSPDSQKRILLQSNIDSLLHRKEEVGKSVFDQLHMVLSSQSGEEKIEEIKRNVSHLVNARPKIFGRDLFYEMMQHTRLFSQSGGGARHLSRIIAYQYLFKKIIGERMQNAPLERHVSFKVLRLSNESPTQLALILGFNFIKETERYEVKHLVDAIKSAIPGAHCSAESVVADRREDKIRIYYLEISKESFSFDEIRFLKRKFPGEALKQIENVFHPVFMPRNDEDLIRNLIVLNKQIKYVRDLPQVSIHYEMQSESELTYTILLARLVKPSTAPLTKILHEKPSAMRFDIEDTRIVGYLKNKYPKEASILKTTLDKRAFFRPDHSVDLLRARQRIVFELSKLLGEFRDFNGGIILKQDEALTSLRDSIGPLSADQELLLENYFYSLRPGIMQTVYEPDTLKGHFSLLLKAIDTPLKARTYQIFSFADGKYWLAFIKAISPTFKEQVHEIAAALQIPSYDLTTTLIQHGQISLLGMILRLDNKGNSSLFEEKIGEAMQQWGVSVACVV